MTTDDGRVVRDLVYARLVGFRPLSLDLHRPTRPGAPLVVFVHGGGWRAGDRRVFCPTMPGDEPFAQIVKSGLAVAAVDYRLSHEAVFPAQLHDVATAVAWLRANASELEIDATRVVLWGESAGATIAALVGLDPVCDVAGIVDWYGPADLVELSHSLGQSADPTSREAGWLGAPVGTDEGRARSASPLHHIHAGAPPISIAHGLADEAVPVAQSIRFAEALRQAGVPVDLQLVEGAGHMWHGDVDRDVLLESGIAFARRVLR